MTTDEVVGMIAEDIETMDGYEILKCETLGNTIFIQFFDGSNFEIEVDRLPDLPSVEPQTGESKIIE